VIVQAGLTLEDIYFANRVPLHGWDLVKNKVSGMLNQKLKFPFTYASSIVAVARISG
jgi:hypothetical protein